MFVTLNKGKTTLVATHNIMYMTEEEIKKHAYRIDRYCMYTNPSSINNIIVRSTYVHYGDLIQ